MLRRNKTILGKETEKGLWKEAKFKDLKNKDPALPRIQRGRGNCLQSQNTNGKPRDLEQLKQRGVSWDGTGEERTQLFRALKARVRTSVFICNKIESYHSRLVTWSGGCIEKGLEQPKEDGDRNLVQKCIWESSWWHGQDGGRRCKGKWTRLRWHLKLDSVRLGGRSVDPLVFPFFLSLLAFADINIALKCWYGFPY